MKRLVYASRARFDFSPDELVSLLSTSRSNNVRVGLTGMLLYTSQSFLQMLEGDADVVDSTYRRIADDDRHLGLRLLQSVDVAERMFPDWTMGFEHVDDEELAEQLPGFTAAVRYPLVNPDLVSNGAVAQTLLKLYAKNRVS